MRRSTETASEVLRVVLPGDLKEAFAQRCDRRRQSMSERVRHLIVEDLNEDLSTEPTPQQQLSEILASARRKNEASGLPTPDMEEIDAFIDEVRAERIAKAHVA